MWTRITVTEEDITGATRTTVDNPITRALQRATGHKWCIFHGNTAYSLVPPHHALKLPPVVSRIWADYLTTGIMQPFEFDLDSPRSVTVAEFEKRQNADRRREERRREERRRLERRGPRTA